MRSMEVSGCRCFVARRVVFNLFSLPPVIFIIPMFSFVDNPASLSSYFVDNPPHILKIVVECAGRRYTPNIYPGLQKVGCYCYLAWWCGGLRPDTTLFFIFLLYNEILHNIMVFLLLGYFWLFSQTNSHRWWQKEMMGSMHSISPM